MTKFGKTKNDEKDRQQWLKNHKPLVYKKVVEFPNKVDQGESIAIIQFQYDFICNFRCKHCSVDDFKKSAQNQGKTKMTLEEVKDLADQADEMGLANWVITGGEPLIFPDLELLIETVGTDRFFMAVDTNGYHLDHDKAKWLKGLGVDKIQLSIDGSTPKWHDSFRNKKGSWGRCIEAIEACKDNDLHVIIQTVLWKDRVAKKEFKRFLDLMKLYEVGTYVSFAKPVGAYAGCFDCLVDETDARAIEELEKDYDVFTHLTPSYGRDIGCIGVKRMVAITGYGDVMPCPYVHVSLGNIKDEPLDKIIARGLKTKWFGYKPKRGCICAMDQEFIKDVVKKTYDRDVPIYYKEVFPEIGEEKENEPKK